MRWVVFDFLTRLGTMRTARTTTMTTTERMMRFLFCPGLSELAPLGEEGPLGVLGLGGVTPSCYAPPGAVGASPPPSARLAPARRLPPSPSAGRARPPHLALRKHAGGPAVTRSAGPVPR